MLWTEGSRLIPAAEAGLLGSAEVPFAILFGWLFLAEFPPVASLLGGAIVLAAVMFAHVGGATFRWRRRRTGDFAEKNALSRRKIEFFLEPYPVSGVCCSDGLSPCPNPLARPPY